MGEGAPGYVVISPVSFDPEREWGNDKWKELVARITSRGMRVALTGMPSQEDYLSSLARADGGKANVNVFTKMSLAEFGALMRDASFFVGIDSFPAHLALASGKESIVLVNPAAYYLKGYSPKKFSIDARNMLPLIKKISFFDITSASAVDVEDIAMRLVHER